MGGEVRQAVILAAGEAQRLRPLTHRRPKGMLLVGGQPLLQHLLDTLRATGVESVVLVVGAHSEKVQSFFKDGRDFGLRISYAHQGQPTGTADAVRHALPLVDRRGPCLLLPGDNYLSTKSLLPLNERTGDVLLLSNPRHGTRYGIPVLQGERLTSIHYADVSPGSTRVSSGVVRASPRLIDFFADAKKESLHDLDQVLDAYLQGGNTVTVADVEGPWEDVNSPWDVLQLNEHVLHQMANHAPKTPGLNVVGAVHVGKNSFVAPSATLVGPVTIGEGCHIGEFTVIGPYVSIRNNTTVGAHCEIRRSILNNNVVVDSRALIRGSILDDGVSVASGFVCHETSTGAGLVGCVIGADTEIGPDCRAASGALIPPETRIPAGTRIPRQE
ncbi:MAG: NDP-sugar synthase [Euryarchaeota archaeon]|nr:NDP-sugar synthase [Euryarchaeota archaeon]